jgi:hypothetical protein
MTLRVALTLLAGGLLAAVPRAEAGELNALFDLSLRLGGKGITLGGHVDGPDGRSGITLNGRLQPGGVIFDGWLEDRGRAWLFELDADVKDGLRATVRRAPLRI